MRSHLSIMCSMVLLVASDDSESQTEPAKDTREEAVSPSTGAIIPITTASTIPGTGHVNMASTQTEPAKNTSEEVTSPTTVAIIPITTASTIPGTGNVNMASSWPSSPPEENNVTCLDNTGCLENVATCCTRYSIRTTCPSHIPVMCRWKACYHGSNYCCVSTAASCDAWGGVHPVSVLTQCENNSQCNHPSASRCVDNLCAECNNDASCTDLSKPVCKHSACLATCESPGYSCSSEMPIKRENLASITCPEAGCTDATCCVECNVDFDCSDPVKPTCRYNVCTKSYQYEELDAGVCPLLVFHCEVMSDAQMCQFGCDARHNCAAYNFARGINICYLYTSTTRLRTRRMTYVNFGKCVAKRAEVVLVAKKSTPVPKTNGFTRTASTVADTKEFFTAGKTRCRKNCLMLCGGEGPGSFQQECADAWCKEASPVLGSECARACQQIAQTNGTVLCTDVNSLQDPWTNPQWKQEWYQTEFNAFMNEVALGETFKYPETSFIYHPRDAPTDPRDTWQRNTHDSDSHWNPGQNVFEALRNYTSHEREDRPYTDWLVPSCADDDESMCPNMAHKKQAELLMVSFNNWFQSREKIGDASVGGAQMRDEDVQDAKNYIDGLDANAQKYPRCSKRCQAWCEAACACNWMWDSPWANSEPMGWTNGHAMRFRWSLKFSTWKCLNSHDEPYRCPQDNATWSIDITNADEHLVTLKFLLNCSHLTQLYRKSVCPESMQCDLDCKTAAAQIVDFCEKHKLLKAIYSNDAEKKAALVATLDAGIRTNCRGSCAKRFMDTEQFKEAHPGC